MVAEYKGASHGYTNINEHFYKTKICCARSKIYEIKP